MNLSDLVSRHAETLQSAVRANAERTFHAHWPEAPSGKIYGETANDDGLAAFKGQMGQPFLGLLQTSDGPTVGQEVSPYGFDLGISYPGVQVEALVTRANDARVAWTSCSPGERAAVLIEALERASKRFFEIGYATMHTTGQGFVMAFQASGPHAFDRALEAIAMGYSAQSMFVESVDWTKPMGKTSVTIQKSYRIVPKGINLVIGCSTFPVWNTTPAMFAGLVTGNAVIIKPHPGAVYPIAIVVAEVQKTLRDFGFDPHLCQLAVDTIERPITLDILRHPSVTVVDYTGGPQFGAVVEREAAQANKVVFTEKAGVNSVVFDSAESLDAALDNLAFALSLYSGQMCTAPQNIFVPRHGVVAGDRQLTAREFADALTERVNALVGNEKAGPGTLGAIQNANTARRVEEAAGLGLQVLRAAAPVRQAGFDNARSISPLLLLTDDSRADVFEREWFGPIAFVIETESFDSAIEHVVRGVRQHGALTTLVYTTDSNKQQRAEDAIVGAGAPVAFNFNSYVWVNQSAAFSDFHGAGANPAGNATFADLTFVTARYNVVGVRVQK